MDHTDTRQFCMACCVLWQDVFLNILVNLTSFRVKLIVSNVSEWLAFHHPFCEEKCWFSVPDLCCFDRPKPQDFVKSVRTLLVFFNRGYSIKRIVPTHLFLRSDLVVLIRSNYSLRIAVIKRKAAWDTWSCLCLCCTHWEQGFNSANAVI